MIPQYVRQVAPQYTLPGGQTAVANVGVGQAVSQLGAGIKQAAERKLTREDTLAVNRAWRDIEQWQLDYLSGAAERREELRRTQVDPETGSTVTGYQVEIEGFGKKLDERYAQASADLSTRAKEELEKRFNAHAPTYGRYTADTLSTLELEDITAEIQDLARTDRVADAKELFELYSDRYSPGDRQRIEANIEEAAVEARLGSARTYLQNHAKAQGWDSAVSLIDDPEWQQAMGLDIADSATVHNVLSTFARTQEGKEQRAAAVEAETARNNMFADARQDKLDPAAIDPAERAGIISQAEAKELYALIEKGPPEQSDPDIWLEALGKVEAAQTDPSVRDEAISFLRKNVTKLTPANFQSLSSQAYSTAAPDNPLTAPTPKLLSKLIDETYDLGGFGEWGSPEAQQQYINARQRFVAFVQQNPDADDEALNAKYRDLVEPVARPNWLGRLRDWFFAPVQVRQSYMPGAWMPMPPTIGEQPVLNALESDEPTPTFRPVDETSEPETIDEFERTLMSLPPESKAQQDYYEKWVGKWQ